MHKNTIVTYKKNKRYDSVKLFGNSLNLIHIVYLLFNLTNFFSTFAHDDKLLRYCRTHVLINVAKTK